MAAPPALHPQVEAKLKQYFNEIDTNKNGRLEANELAAAFKKGGFVFPDHVLKRMIRVTDKTGKNSLSFDEFLQLTAFLEEMRTNFRRADQDGNGKVDQAELGRVLLDAGFNLSSSQIKQLMNVVDSDHSGTVEFTEFIDMAFYLQLLNRAFNQAHVDGKFSATELQSILQQLGFDAAVGANIKDKSTLSFEALLDIAAPIYSKSGKSLV